MKLSDEEVKELTAFLSAAPQLTASLRALLERLSQYDEHETTTVGESPQRNLSLDEHTVTTANSETQICGRNICMTVIARLTFYS